MDLLADARAHLRAVRQRTDALLVSASAGKDSAAVLALVAEQKFKRVVAFHLHLVEGLSFIERPLRAQCERFGAELISVPHPDLFRYMRTGTLMPIPINVPAMKLADVWRAVRKEQGIAWIAAGYKRADSLHRRLMLMREDWGAVDVARSIVAPLDRWKESDVESFVKNLRVPLAPKFRVNNGKTSGGFDVLPATLAHVRDAYPEDFKRVEQIFPFARAAAMQHDIKARASRASG